MNKLLEFARTLATDMGDTMRHYFGDNLRSRQKLDMTIVTEVDERNLRLVLYAAANHSPKLAVYGEEGQAAQSNAPYTLVVDEVDGTALLARGIPLPVVSVAVVDRTGRPVIGVVDEPLGKERRQYCAIAGGSAYMSVSGKLARLRVSSKILDSTAMIDAEWWPGALKGYDFVPRLHEFSRKTGTYVLCQGSVVSGFMAVARGAFEACVFAGATAEKTVDSAAAKVIIEAAGGKVSDLFGNTNLVYDGRPIQGILATNGNPEVHDQLLTVCQPIS